MPKRVKEDHCGVCNQPFSGLAMLRGAVFCPECKTLVHSGCTKTKLRRVYCLNCYRKAFEEK